jgi:hypothetical protein
LGLGAAWEAFEWAVGLIGNWTDTWTDAALTTLGVTLAAALSGVRRGGPEATADVWRGARGPSG